MQPVVYISIALLSYLIGSVSFARIVTRIWSGENVAEFKEPIKGEEETYQAISIGANIVSTKLGAKAGMFVSVLDILKVAIPTFITKNLFPGNNWMPIISSISAMTGHIWPIYYKFHGGVGFSSVMGGLLILDPLAVLVTPLIGIFVGLVVLRNMVVATLSWLWLLIPWFGLRKAGEPEFILYAIAVNILFTLAMIPEIKVRIKLEKEGKASSYMASNPMMRGYIKIAKALGYKIDENDEGSKPKNEGV